VNAVAKSDYEIWFIDDRFRTGSNWTGNSSERCGRMWMEERDGEFVYKISSPLIKNDKYNSFVPNYNVKFSRSPDKIYEIAREYLRPIAWTSIFDVPVSKALMYHRKWVEEAEYEYRHEMSAVNKRMIPNEVLDALISERAMNVKFCSPLLNDLTKDKLVSTYKEHVRRSNLGNYSAYVFTEAVKSAGVPEDMEVAYVDKPTGHTLKDADIKFCSKAGLPVAHQELIAMLAMMEPGSYLPDVGYRAADHIYYLY
jgi:hypothetical protein